MEHSEQAKAVADVTSAAAFANWGWEIATKTPGGFPRREWGALTRRHCERSEAIQSGAENALD
jgi:hypothetical protein